jgi:hypothetical protein
MYVCVVCVCVCVFHIKDKRHSQDNKDKEVVVQTSKKKSPVMSLGIFSEATDGTMCPGVDSASKNEYQENSWE